MGSEEVFGIYNVGITVFFNAMQRKRRFTNFLIGLYGALGISMTLRYYYFLLSGSTDKGFILLGV